MTKKYDWSVIQKHYDDGGSWRTIGETFGCTGSAINKAAKRGDLKARPAGESTRLGFKSGRLTRLKHSEETKQIISIKRKLFLKNNPDKHPWRKPNNFKSVPCSELKNWLISKNIQFVSEYTNHGVPDRHFSLDIAFPDKMAVIEVNGNQHYEKDGSLKIYYSERETLLKLAGWKIYQFHYTQCFKEKERQNLLDSINGICPIIEFDFVNYLNKKATKKYKCKSCFIEKNQPGKLCWNCYGLSMRRVVRPTKEVLHNLVWSNPMTNLAKMYGVSDNSIRSWCISYDLLMPSLKYQSNFRAGNIIDYQI